MKKKFFAIYALAGALVASPIFTSCVDDTVSESVEALRNAKAEALQAEAAHDKALADAALINANANATLQAAQAEFQKANAAYQAALAKAKELQNQKDEATLESDLENLLLQNQIDLEAKKLALAKAQANAELALEQAKLEAQNALLTAQKDNLENQKALDDMLASLEGQKQKDVTVINKNIRSILNGGWYKVKNQYGNWEQNRYYQTSYNKDDDNAINTINAKLATENISLIQLKNGLIDWTEYLAEVKAEKEETILENEALIKKYTELQATSNRESLEKTYEEALEKTEDLANQILDKNAEIMVANQALATFDNKNGEDPIIQLIAGASDYLTEKEHKDGDCFVDTVVVDGLTSYFEKHYANVYEHSAEDAEELATAITDKETEIADKEKEISELEEAIASVNIDELQRELAVEKAELAKIQKEYNDVLASEGYKAALKKLEDALAAAQAAFNANPTDIPAYQAEDENGNLLYEKNEDGTLKQDENGNPIPVMIQGTKQDLIDAENALAAFDYNYGTEAEPKNVSELLDKLNTEDTGVDDNNGNRIYGQKALVEYYQGEVDGALDDLNDDLDDLNDDLDELNEDLEALKEIQAMVAADSEEMKAYLALCEERAKLQKAVFVLEAEKYELDLNRTYWSTLSTTLDNYVDEDSTDPEKLPDYASLIEEAEEDIAEAKKEIERLNLLAEDEDGNTVDTQAAREAAIAEKEAAIAAMNDELVIRQAEYEAEVAALKALIETAE